MFALIAAAALLQFAPIDSPANLPAPSFDLHGLTADLAPAPAPVLFPGDGGPDRALVAFSSPVDGRCALGELVTVDGKPMFALLAQSVVTKGEPEIVRATLPSANDLRDAGAIADGTSIVVECAAQGQAPVASRVYHIGPNTAA